ncbi:unnamed protein product, partial [Oncorhynchus mykiss]
PPLPPSSSLLIHPLPPSSLSSLSSLLIHPLPPSLSPSSSSEPLNCDGEFWDLRDSVVQCELLVLRQLNFHVSFQHPHKYLLHYLLSVKSLVNRHAWSRTPVAETTWALLRDCYHGTMCVRHAPQHIAIATLYLALLSYGVEVPVGEREWWQVGGMCCEERERWGVIVLWSVCIGLLLLPYYCQNTGHESCSDRCMIMAHSKPDRCMIMGHSKPDRCMKMAHSKPDSCYNSLNSSVKVFH